MVGLCNISNTRLFNCQIPPVMPVAASTPALAEKSSPAFALREIFIGGAPRSGTTLLLSLLDSHPDLLVFPKETYLFDQSIKKVGTHDAGRLARYLLAHTEVAELNPQWSTEMGSDGALGKTQLPNFNYPAFEKNFLWRSRQRPAGGPRHVLHSLFRAYAETWPSTTQDRPGIFVEKTPGNDYFSDELFKHFPESKLIQIVRDPRAVYASRQTALRRRRGRHTKSFRLVNEWNRSVWQRQRLRNRSDQFLSIRYEDLIAYPRSILEQVCQFIGISVHPLNMAPTKGGKPWRGNSSFGDIFSGISQVPLNRWKEDLSDDEVAWVEYHCQQGMEDCGYQILTDLSSPKTNLKQWLRPLPWESTLGYLKARRASLCWKLFPHYMMRAH